MPSWFWKTLTENKECNTWGLSIEYIVWQLILVSCVWVQLGIKYGLIFLYTAHTLTPEVLCKLLFEVMPVLHCVAVMPFPGKVSCTEIGGLEEEQPGNGHLNSLFCTMTLEETPATDWSVTQLSPLNCDLCGSRGVLLLCFTAKSNRLLWCGEKWTQQLLLPSWQVTLLALMQVQGLEKENRRHLWYLWCTSGSANLPILWPSVA